MHRLLKACAALFFIGLFLTGCSQEAEPKPRYRVVTEISVTASHNSEIRYYRYTQPQEMHAMLNYLRRLDTYAPVPIAPDTFRGDAFRIVLHRSDGTQSVYHQIADGYLQKDGSVWEKVESRHASTLLRLLETMPGDEP